MAEGSKRHRLSRYLGERSIATAFGSVFFDAQKASVSISIRIAIGETTTIAIRIAIDKAIGIAVTIVILIAFSTEMDSAFNYKFWILSLS